MILRPEEASDKEYEQMREALASDRKRCPQALKHVAFRGSRLHELTNRTDGRKDWIRWHIWEGNLWVRKFGGLSFLKGEDIWEQRSFFTRTFYTAEERLERKQKRR